MADPSCEPPMGRGLLHDMADAARYDEVSLAFVYFVSSSKFPERRLTLLLDTSPSRLPPT